MDAGGDLRRAADHVGEAVRLLTDAAVELEAAGNAAEGKYARGVADELRRGAFDGWLLIGPKDEAVAVALWEPPSELGRAAVGYLAEGYRRPEVLRRFLERVGGRPGGPVRTLGLLGRLLPPAELVGVMGPLGFVPQERVDLVFPSERPPPAPDAALEPRIRPLRPADEPAIARLIERAYADMPLERALFARRADAAADAREAAALIVHRLGTWWPDASFAVDAPHGLAAATLVNDYLGPLLSEVMTDPEHRGRGLATALIGRSVAAVRERTGAPLRLVVTWSNERARRLYLGLGFVPVEASRGTTWVRPLGVSPSTVPPAGTPSAPAG